MSRYPKASVAVLLPLMVLIGAIMTSVQPSDGPTRHHQQQAHGDSEIARLLAYADRVLEVAPEVRVDYGTMSMSFLRESQAIVMRSGEQRRVLDRSGDLSVYQGGCLRLVGRTSPASPQSAVIPMSESSVRFSAPIIRDDGITTAAFEAKQLGSWGRGRGEMQFQNGAPISFSFQPSGQKRTMFTVSYPRDPEDLPDTSGC